MVFGTIYLGSNPSPRTKFYRYYMACEYCQCAAESEEEKIARINAVLEKFKPIVKLTLQKENYPWYIGGPWIVNPGYYSISLQYKFYFHTEEFSKDATTEELKTLMITMLEKSDQFHAEAKERIAKCHKSLWHEYARMQQLE